MGMNSYHCITNHLILHLCFTSLFILFNCIIFSSLFNFQINQMKYCFIHYIQLLHYILWYIIFSKIILYIIPLLSYYIIYCCIASLSTKSRSSWFQNQIQRRCTILTVLHTQQQLPKHRKHITATLKPPCNTKHG